MLVKDQDARYGWFWQLKNLPDAPESRYLYALLAGHDFQEGLKNYRDLVYMGGTLDRWSDSMVAFEDMIETRERAYAERLPRADALLASGAVGKLQQRDLALEAELSAIEARHDVAALGTDDRARAVGAHAAHREPPWRAPRTRPTTPTCARACALVKGVLFYRLNDAYGARLWQEHRGLKDLDLALHEAQSRWIRVERARKNVPVNTGEFAARVAALKVRIDALQTRLADAEQRRAATWRRSPCRSWSSRRSG